jgi:D-cysteine desulfhydrase
VCRKPNTEQKSAGRGASGRRLHFTTRPSRVFRAEALERPGVEFFVKNDGALATDYGGNKARKLERILTSALERGARRVVTFGPAGSHHVLATTWFARRVGLPTTALLFRQPASRHAEENLRVSLAAGLDPVPVPSLGLLPLALARVVRPGDWVVPPGGASREGVLAFSDAVDELLAQVEAGDLKAPNAIVVAVGTGGTAAGLLAGLRRREQSVTLIGADVGVLGRRANAVVERLSRLEAGSRRDSAAGAEFALDRTHAGRGYGRPCESSSLARDAARTIGLKLDPSYTEKAFATALTLVEEASERLDAGRRRFAGGLRLLYWHTLSETLPPVRPTSAPLPPELSALLETTHTSPAATK